MLGLLKFTVNFTIKSWLRSMFKLVINVQDNYSSSSLHARIFSLLNPMCFFLVICFKIKKCFGQVNVLKFGQS